MRSVSTHIQAYVTSLVKKLLYSSHHRWNANPYLLIYKKIVLVYFENQKKSINILCGCNTVLLIFKNGGRALSEPGGTR